MAKKGSNGVAAVLQFNLTEYILLSLQVKQAHWNLVGPRFLAIHEFMDQVYGSLQTAIDSSAERMRALQVVPNGNLDQLTAVKGLDPMPTGEIRDLDAAGYILTRIVHLIDVQRERLEKVEDADVVTADMIHSHLEQLEMHAWMLRATTTKVD
jgi:starvation-inducible DNA-binding protein